jgi:hypothetical protein
MSVLTYALVLLGCSDAGDDCQALQTQQAAFATRAECTAQIEPALMSDVAASADYPSVLARCDLRPARSPRPAANRTPVNAPRLSR